MRRGGVGVFRGKSRVQQHQIVYHRGRGRWAASSTRWRCRPGCRRVRPRRAGQGTPWRDNERGALFRKSVANQHSRVTYAELFFDLVFVFAVTQISHTLLGRFTPLGAIQTTLLFLSVWWVWVYTSWITNWLNPELTPVRVLLFLLMLGGLVLSTSIPKAFESRGLLFAIAYAAMQVGRTVFLLVSTPPRPNPGAHECGSHPGLAVDVGHVLDRRRFCRRALAAGAMGLGAGHRICLAGGPVLDSGIRRFFGGGLGRRGRSHGRALRAASSSSRSANPSSSPARPSPICPGPPRRSWRSWRPSSAASRCGGSISTRAPRPAPSRFQDPANRGGWRGSPIPICICRSWPASYSRRSPTSWC